VQIRNEEEGTWYEAFVDAHDLSIISITDFVAYASVRCRPNPLVLFSDRPPQYTVLRATKQILPEGVGTIINPADFASSPFGWHSDGTTNFTNTTGNNVVVFKGSQSNPIVTPQSADGLVFDYFYDVNLEPASSPDASRTNAFYICNTVHDVTYRYGFTEAAFNFQRNNAGKGGEENDRVLIGVQDPSRSNNANFITLPEYGFHLCHS
jgi:extracellular elastinolytic metalloproteinase